MAHPRSQSKIWNRLPRSSIQLFLTSVSLFLLGCVPVPDSKGKKSENSSPLANQIQILEEQFQNRCWITYTPSTFDPTTDPVTWPTKSEVKQDLAVLAKAGFQGLVTYRAFFYDRNSPTSPLDLPNLAKDLGFQGMVLGVWNPKDETELRAAEGHRDAAIVLGYSVGNEGLDHRYDLSTLTRAMTRLRQTTGKPITTTEEVTDYFQNHELLQISDWIFPNGHPYFAGLKDPERAAIWTSQIDTLLRALTTKPVVFKEVGLPTNGAPEVSEARQAQYYQFLQQTPVNYVVFAGFDLPWKQPLQAQPGGENPEPYWGIFHNDRQPKEAVATICN